MKLVCRAAFVLFPAGRGMTTDSLEEVAVVAVVIEVALVVVAVVENEEGLKTVEEEASAQILGDTAGRSESVAAVAGSDFSLFSRDFAVG